MPVMTHITKPPLKAVLAAGFCAAWMSLGTAVANADSMNWDAVAQCESGGNWAANTGNGAYGGLQFKQATWEEYGGVGNPAQASKQQQIAVANRVLASQGPGAWPKCSRASGATPGNTGVPNPGLQLQQTLTSIIGIFTPR
ncbi:resuscitation-promoting factor RpfC [Mycobacterium kiyosense]|uniref:Resuscitation-promoting factor RpfC n=2 Tax=Mycobacteriaceae TaxID=1762 RepID=A0AA37PWG3_9MYCO|nr:resuscitation-promoting factor RpfC [Mycobacterium kiyosense]BDE14237.1 resuscitation-promoting factor RpfC [Mycobacterium sp. 20KCMC460]GLB81547.1 resuscitation-promoting factor RpfC [Mycobacterium kiyosense]GLB90144.1 resuscitation-promoting factor RpfC [Mycobacterium kiyosense]GLB93740.1 resuscitation-promoting factor RpfC [Mycobacterium kiyosense]